MIRNVKNFAIRLSLLFISIIGIYFCNNVNAVCLDYGLGNNGIDYCYDVGNIYYLPGNTTERNVEFTFDQNGNFTSSMNYFGGAIQLYSNVYYHAYGWKNGSMIKLNNTNNNSGNEWVFSGACLGSLQNEYLSSYGARAYNGEPCASSVLISSSSFSNLELWGNIDMIIASFVNERILFCYASSSTDQVLCFNEYGGVTVQDSATSPSGVSAPYNFVNIGSDFFGINPYISYNGGGSSNNNNSIIYQEGNTLNNTISYYENILGWDQNICYVGTNDITSPYGTAGISFQYGTGETIFGLYNGLYSGFGSNIIQNVGRFVNTWLINYSQWFATSPSNRLYLASYDGPGSNVTYYYTGLSFPYANKPVAIYFMSDLIYNEYSNASTQGEEVAYYCYLKLNKSNIEDGVINFEDVQDLVTPGIVGRINDNVNSYLTGRVGFLVPNLSGSVWGDVSSGSVFDGDVDPSNTFEDFYNDILGIVDRGNYSGSGILPPRIIYPLLFLILFRIIKH